MPSPIDVFDDSELSLSERIEAVALDLGFAKVGFLPAVTLYEEAALVQDWLANGYGADMDWMREHWPLKTDPGQLVPGLKSIICVAINYYPGDFPEGVTNKIARYAQGRDYHRVIRKKLAKLLKTIQTWVPEADGRPFCDSAPVLERALAVRAGLGWQGKNGNLITKEVGSWVFLAELFLTIPIETNPITMVSDHCGRCTRCLEACPTDAFVAPQVLDSTRCIAYWTIENRGNPLPQGIAHNLEGWAFGCDVCQEVCPWNIKFAQLSQESAFQSQRKQFDVPKVFEMDQTAFDQAYAGASIRRTSIENIKQTLSTLKQ